MSSTSTPTIIKISQPFDKVAISCLGHKGPIGPGAAYGSITWGRADLFTEPLLRHGVGPIVAWGDFAMRYYGVPTAIPLIHILIDDSQLDTAFNALLDAGHIDSTDDINKFSNWKEIGDRFFQILVNSPDPDGYPADFLIQGFSVCKPYMTPSRASTFPVLHGLSIPPLKALAESFIVTTFKFKNPRSLTCHLFRAWRGYLMECGYNPLSEDAIQPSEVIDEDMVYYWRTGHRPSDLRICRWSAPLNPFHTQCRHLVVDQAAGLTPSL